jgi:hypothetical protein
MDFGEAIRQLKGGYRVERAGWNGKGMYLFYVQPGWPYDNTEPEHPTLPFIAMKTADHTVVPWLASQTDMLATDWSLL